MCALIIIEDRLSGHCKTDSVPMHKNWITYYESWSSALNQDAHISRGCPLRHCEGPPQKQQITLIETIVPIVLRKRRKIEKRRGRRKIGKKEQNERRGPNPTEESIYSFIQPHLTLTRKMLFNLQHFPFLHTKLWSECETEKKGLLWANVKSHSTLSCCSGRERQDSCAILHILHGFPWVVPFPFKSYCAPMDDTTPRSSDVYESFMSKNFSTPAFYCLWTWINKTLILC